MKLKKTIKKYWLIQFIQPFPFLVAHSATILPPEPVFQIKIIKKTPIRGIVSKLTMPALEKSSLFEASHEKKQNSLIFGECVTYEDNTEILQWHNATIKSSSQHEKTSIVKFAENNFGGLNIHFLDSSENIYTEKPFNWKPNSEENKVDSNTTTKKTSCEDLTKSSSEWTITLELQPGEVSEKSLNRWQGLWNAPACSGNSKEVAIFLKNTDMPVSKKALPFSFEKNLKQFNPTIDKYWSFNVGIFGCALLIQEKN
jgi:hypothetical protein